MQEDSLKRVKHERTKDSQEGKKEQQENENNNINNIEGKPGAIYVSYDIERELNIVIANVMDSKTKEKIRQIPPEEIVRNKKFLKAYQETFNSRGNMDNNNDIEKQKIR